MTNAELALRNRQSKGEPVYSQLNAKNETPAGIFDAK